MPQVVNAVLSRHNFILLGLRGQAKTRLIRQLTDTAGRMDAVPGGLRDSRQPATRRSAAGAAIWWPARASDAPIAWLHREDRYVEKLATPDVTIADMIGDIDPIKAARRGQDISRRADGALRAAAARQPRHFRDQRTARPGGQDPGGAVQHHAGRRRAD